MTSIQNQVLTAGLPAGADSNAKKLPPVERQARIVEQKQRLVGVIIQGESEPSFELIDLAYSMIESKSIKFIPPHRCTKRDTELLENTSKDKEILTIEQGRLTTKKSSLPNASTSDALKLSNCFVRRALAGFGTSFNLYADQQVPPVASCSTFSQSAFWLFSSLSPTDRASRQVLLGQICGKSWH